MQQSAKATKFLLPAMLLGLCLTLPLAQAAQSRFSSPELAAEALVDALVTHDPAQLRSVLGDDFRRLLPTDDVNREDVTAFLEQWAKGHSMQMQGDDRALLQLHNGWQLPIPLVRDARGWRFDTAAARELIKQQRIGRNELAVIDAMRAYVRAQQEYFARGADDKAQYAARLLSTTGRQDGLIWVNEQGDYVGLIDPLINLSALQDGYYGYRFKTLKAQGEGAPGGAMSYLDNEGRMSKGFALLAYPVRYGESGVMSFLVGQDGKVYEKNLGRDTARKAAAITRYAPGEGWQLVESVAQ